MSIPTLVSYVKKTQDRFWYVAKYAMPPADNVAEAIRMWLTETTIITATFVFCRTDRPKDTAMIDITRESDYTENTFINLAKLIITGATEQFNGRKYLVYSYSDSIKDANGEIDFEKSIARANEYLAKMQNELVNEWKPEKPKGKKSNSTNPTRVANKAKEAEKKRKEEFLKQVAEAEKHKLEQARKKAQKKAQKK